MNIALFGPPGSGKGTQAELLCDRFKLVHLSTGDILRAERRKCTELGKRVGEIMKEGRLVPDEIVGELVQKRVQEAMDEGRGVLFDGYPRNLRQLQRLESLLTVLDTQIDHFVSLDIAPPKVVDRMVSRRTCRSCGRVYNLKWQPPETDGVCDACGGELYQRADDRSEAIEKRLVEYGRQTEPLMQNLTQRGLLQKVCAEEPVEEVFSQIMELIRRNGRRQISVS